MTTSKLEITSIALACSLAAALFASSGCAKKLEQGDPAPVLALLRCAGTCGAATVNTEFSAPTMVTISGYSGDAMEPSISRDGNYLFFNSLNNGIDTSLYYAAKGADDVTFNSATTITGVNGTPPHLDAVASMDENEIFYFISTRNWPVEIRNVYTGTFSGATGTVTGLVNLDGDFYINEPGWIIMDGEISPDGLNYYFVNAHFTGGSVPDRSDIGVAEFVSANTFNRIADNDAVMAAVNTARCLEYAPSISADGLELFFTRLDLCPLSSEILVSKRATTDDPFGEPARIGAITGFVEAPSISLDGKRLYFHRNDDGVYNIYMVTRP